MHTDLLTTALNLISPMSAALEKRFETACKLEKHPRKHLLLKENQVAKKIYFINEGFARSYYETREGKQCTTWFMGKGDLMIAVHSFYTQLPALENIELLEDSELLSLGWNELQSIYADFPEFNYIGRLVTEKYYIMAEERAILLRTLTARERYEKLLQVHPGIIQKATLGQLASYLGITQETLSRVRNTRTNLTKIKKTA